ncbi:MAG: hypothetical protein NC113_07835 [Bacteroides sp.]|nr:hypothetical protein [Bacteroides sp.]MCM1448110.1 hypothetical protein [Bacteroides sp.]MCM1515550.1 hypothetical protein [Paraprevotella sp.]
MKKVLVLVVVMSITAFALSSLVNASPLELSLEDDSEVAITVHSQGKYCSGTVGCNCSGFSPITNGEEWKKLYCRKCGHYKGYHKK